MLSWLRAVIANYQVLIDLFFLRAVDVGVNELCGDQFSKFVLTEEQVMREALAIISVIP